jgi:hypothetical protein
MPILINFFNVTWHPSNHRGTVPYTPKNDSRTLARRGFAPDAGFRGGEEAIAAALRVRDYFATKDGGL